MDAVNKKIPIISQKLRKNPVSISLLTGSTL